jgi:hypothetical protein
MTEQLAGLLGSASVVLAACWLLLALNRRILAALPLADALR